MTDQPAPPPTSVRVAAGLWLATAVFVLVTVISLWANRSELARLNNLSPGEVTDILWSLTTVSLIFSVGYAVLTIMFWRGRKWSRPALSVLAFGHLLWLLATGVSAANLVTLLLISAAVVLTWRPGTAQWLAEVGR